MLVTDFADEMCWWQVWDVGDQFKNHQDNKKVANIIDSTTNIFNWSASSNNQHNDTIKNERSLNATFFALYPICKSFEAELVEFRL